MCKHALALAVALLSGTCQGQSILGDAERSSLEDGARFRILGASTAPPREILGFCADHNGNLAAPGARWNSIDVMISGLPSRRLIWVARSDGFYVTHYEQGGFSHSNHVTVARIKSNPEGYELIWRAEGPRLRDYADFTRSLKSNAFHPEPLANR